MVIFIVDCGCQIFLFCPQADLGSIVWGILFFFFLFPQKTIRPSWMLRPSNSFYFRISWRTGIPPVGFVVQLLFRVFGAVNRVVPIRLVLTRQWVWMTKSDKRWISYRASNLRISSFLFGSTTARFWTAGEFKLSVVGFLSKPSNQLQEGFIPENDEGMCGE